MRKRIRLTESDLHRIVKESVNKVLTENTNDFDLNKVSNAIEITYNFIDSKLKGIDWNIGDETLVTILYKLLEQVQHKIGTISDAIADYNKGRGLGLLNDIDNQNYGYESNGEQYDYSGYAGWGG